MCGGCDVKASVLAMCVLIASAGAQAPPPEPSRVLPGVKPPRLLSKVEPEYSEEARRARLVGTVRVRGVVNTAGIAVDLEVVRSVGLGLDDEAVRAVRQWRFAPGTKDGMPVAEIATFEVNFRLLKNDEAQWRLTRAVFDSPEGASRPVLIKSEFPHKAPKEYATVALTFDINEHGEPKN